MTVSAFNTIADIPTTVTFGSTSRCLDCGVSVAGRVVHGMMRNEFREIDGLLHRRFDADHAVCGCVGTTCWLPDDGWPGSREAIRRRMRDHYLERAYDAEQGGAPGRAAHYRKTAYLYDQATDINLLLAYVTVFCRPPAQLAE